MATKLEVLCAELAALEAVERPDLWSEWTPSARYVALEAECRAEAVADRDGSIARDAEAVAEADTVGCAGCRVGATTATQATKWIAYNTAPNGSGEILATGASRTDVETACALADLDLDHVDFAPATDALFASGSLSWSWLPGSGKTIACTRDEAGE